MGIEAILKNFGLDTKQIHVFLASLELGSQPVSILARKTSLNRTTVYAILNELLKYGFVSKYNKMNIQYFAPTAPEGIVDIMKRKKEEFSRYEQETKLAIPEIKARFNPYLSKSNVAYFEGNEGVKNAMENILSEEKNVLAYRSIESWFDTKFAEYMKEYEFRRVNKHKLEMRVIVADTKSARNYFSDKVLRKNTKVKFVKKNNEFGNEIYIYGNKTAIVCFKPGSAFGAIIESDENAKTQSEIFELAWKNN